MSYLAGFGPASTFAGTTGDSPVSSDRQLGISICICTSGRPRELERCLASIRSGTQQPAIVIVSDDARSPVVETICVRYSCRYVQGPASGLCANRNHVIAHAVTSHIALLDDDAVLGRRFVEEAMRLVPTLAPHELISGITHERGGSAGATRATYLGFFAPTSVSKANCFHLNSNLLPRAAFDGVEFDEEIAYGYEDMDVAATLSRLGFRIRYEPLLENSHLPPDPGPGEARRQRESERARYYVALKTRLHRDPGRRLSLATYTVAACAHSVLHALRQGSDPRAPVSDIAWAWKTMRRRARIDGTGARPADRDRRG